METATEILWTIWAVCSINCFSQKKSEILIHSRPKKIRAALFFIFVLLPTYCDYDCKGSKSINRDKAKQQTIAN